MPSVGKVERYNMKQLREFGQKLLQFTRSGVPKRVILCIADKPILFDSYVWYDLRHRYSDLEYAISRNEATTSAVHFIYLPTYSSEKSYGLDRDTTTFEMLPGSHWDRDSIRLVDELLARGYRYEKGHRYG